MGSLQQMPPDSKTGWARVSRQLLIILAVTFLVVLLFMAQLTYRYVKLTDQANRSVRSLQSTFELNQELRSGIQEQINMLHRQFETPSPLALHRFSQLNYTLGERHSRYVTLDIGSDERLAVESIRSLQAELGVQGVQIFDHLRRGERGRAVEVIGQVEELAERLEREFELLNRFQVEKLRTVQASVTGSLKRARLSIASLAASLVLVLGLVTLLLRRRILQPLQQLVEASEEIRRGNFAARCPVRRYDEIGQLATSFNFMAESLATSYATLEHEVQARDRLLAALRAEMVQMEAVRALSSLIRGSAYELNNPLTAIAGFAELQKMKVAATRRDADEIRVLDDILAQTDRCRRIISNLLLVAQPAQSQELVVPINTVVEPIAQLREYEMKVNNIRLIREYGTAELLIRAEPYLLRQLVLTLLIAVEQSVRDTAGSGSVTLRTAVSEGRVGIEVFSGSPFPLPREGQPENKSEEVRSSAFPSCSALAQGLHATFVAGSGDEGLFFNVSFPPASEEGLEAAEERNGSLRK
jgi:nitrogen-specific signal transduction histidine kinase